MIASHHYRFVQQFQKQIYSSDSGYIVRDADIMTPQRVSVQFRLRSLSIFGRIVLDQAPV